MRRIKDIPLQDRSYISYYIEGDVSKLQLVLYFKYNYKKQPKIPLQTIQLLSNKEKSTGQHTLF